MAFIMSVLFPFCQDLLNMFLEPCLLTTDRVAAGQEIIQQGPLLQAETELRATIRLN